MATPSGNFGQVNTGKVGRSLSRKTVLGYAIQAYLMYVLNAIVGYVRRCLPRGLQEPDVVKSYACRRGLPIRVFFPRSYERSTSEKLPTLFAVHGGGFVMGNAEDLDNWNFNFASMHSILVISLNYSKAPCYPFPRAIRDLEAIILAALADPSLPIDSTRVAIAGWSAGGNLAMAVSSLPSMRGGDGDPKGTTGRKIHALVPLYPAVNFTLDREAQAHKRQYKPSLGGFRARPVDYLLRMSPIFDWAYIPPWLDLSNPLLSPAFAARDDLPPYMFTIACELDMLAFGAWEMACRFAGREVKGEKVGGEEIAPVGELILDDERYAFEERTDKSSYRWLLVPDVVHGFDQARGMSFLSGDYELLQDAEMKTEICQALIGEWLFSGPFAASE